MFRGGHLDRFRHGQDIKNRALTVSVMVKVWKDKFWKGYSRGPGNSINGKWLMRKNAFRRIIIRFLNPETVI